MGSVRTRKNYLPKTGWTVSYRDYDDGYYQKGSPISPRLIDNGDGTVTDRVTNLMWVKNLPYSIPGEPNVTSDNLIIGDTGAWANSTDYTAGWGAADIYTGEYYVCAVSHTSASEPTTFSEDRSNHPTYWRVAPFTQWGKGGLDLQAHTITTVLPAIHNYQFAGYSDWRLPNILELLSILDMTDFSIRSPIVVPNNVVAGSRIASCTPAPGKNASSSCLTIAYLTESVYVVEAISVGYSINYFLCRSI